MVQIISLLMERAYLSPQFWKVQRSIIITVVYSKTMSCVPDAKEKKGLSPQIPSKATSPEI